MNLITIPLTAATAKRTAVVSEQPRKPLQESEVRNLVLKPLFISLLAIREAERLRVLCFDGTGRYKRVSGDLGNTIRILSKELTSGMFGAEYHLMQFLEYRFYEDTKNIMTMCRLNIEQFIRCLNYEAKDTDINAQSELTRFLARMAVEFAAEYTTRLEAVCAEVPLKIAPPSIDSLVAIQKSCIDIEAICSADQVNAPDKRKQKALEDALDAAVRRLKNVRIAEADRFSCCGVCANYTYEVCAKGHCKWPAYNASQMRPACKRFKRVNENTKQIK